MHRRGEDWEHLFAVKFWGNLYDTMISMKQNDPFVQFITAVAGRKIQLSTNPCPRYDPDIEAHSRYVNSALSFPNLYPSHQAFDPAFEAFPLAS